MLVSLDIQKTFRGLFFTNRYILNVTDLLAAETPADAIVVAERAITIPDVDFTSYRVSDNIAGTDLFWVKPINASGERVILTQALPLFDVLRVDFGVALGRPSRKYLRGVLAEGDQENYGELLTASLAEFQTNYVNPVLAVTEYVDVDGQPFISGAPFSRVGMRQLRRGSRRRTEPVIPVA